MGYTWTIPTMRHSSQRRAAGGRPHGGLSSAQQLRRWRVLAISLTVMSVVVLQYGHEPPLALDHRSESAEIPGGDELVLTSEDTTNSAVGESEVEGEEANKQHITDGTSTDFTFEMKEGPMTRMGTIEKPAVKVDNRSKVSSCPQTSAVDSRTQSASSEGVDQVLPAGEVVENGGDSETFGGNGLPQFHPYRPRTTGGCAVDGRLHSKGAKGVGPWAALIQVPNTDDVQCTDCHMYRNLRKSKQPQECKKLLTWCPEAEAHAATLVFLPVSGDLLAAWFHGHEGMGKVSIAVARLNRGSENWAPPTIVSSQEFHSAQNPVLFMDPDDDRTIHLLHTLHQAGIGQKTSRIHHLTSTDNGHTWNPHGPVTLNGFNREGIFTRAPPVVAADEDTGHRFEDDPATLLLPIYHTPGNAKTHYSEVFRGTGGFGPKATWEVVPLSKPGDGLVQPTLVRVAWSASTGREGGLLALFRHRFEPSLFEMRSRDNGQTWTPAKRTKLPNNNSGVQMIALASGAILLAFNNIAGDHGGRHVLTLAISDDGGHTWPKMRDIETADKAEDHSAGMLPGGNRYSYPALAEDPHTRFVHVAYTFNRECIKHVIVSEDWVRVGGAAPMVRSSSPHHGGHAR